MIASSTETWRVIARVLDRILANTKLAASEPPSTAFDSKRVPCITMEEYLNRVSYYANCSPSCYVVAFIYIDRLLVNNPQMKLTGRNVHRIALAAIVLAIKYVDDLYMNNLVYARIGGVTLQEFNYMEIGMLTLLNYDLYVDSEAYFEYFNELMLQYLKIEEEEWKTEKMEDCSETPYKPIRNVESMGSIYTVSSIPDLTEQ
eukprot:TRINITY_DN3452_c0_g1_i8.p1 TRINITY_DN3452_c0_g1~~TRINITY_DN3452_c0_g1_i8.p1  ORF type:complete len:202 (-),score=43.07 TRINITY_DN3452_c0_g1_i8:176-781(-)